MIINSVRLHNIRSYIDQDVHFPQGSVLLSGDIGAGKSTILLAIEFALFGILPGSLEGEAMLRNGKNAGYVELYFTVDGKQVIIRRNLKRIKDNVRQDAGWLIINNEKMELTPIELKARILELLGYPKELVAKSKALIYRYTVYTHQEAMKHILFEEPEARLDVFRRIFQVDKYRRISQNTSLLLQSINERRRMIDAQTGDLEERKEKKRGMEDKLKDVRIAIATLEPLEKEQEERIAETKKSIAGIEEKIRDYHELRSRLSSLQAKQEEKGRQAEAAKNEILKLEEEARLIAKKVEASENTLPIFLARTAALQAHLLKMDTGKERKKEASEELESLERDMGELHGMVREQEMIIANSEKAQKKVMELDSCPTCLQPVTEEHKKMIHETEGEKAGVARSLLEKHLEIRREREKRMKDLKLELERINEGEKRFARMETAAEMLAELAAELGKEKELESYADLKAEFKEDEIGFLTAAARQLKESAYLRSMLSEKRKLGEALHEKENSLKRELQEISAQADIVRDKMMLLENTEALYQKARNELNALLRASSEISAKKAGRQKEEEYIIQNITEAEQEIAKKTRLKEELGKLHQLHLFLSEYFIQLMGTIEKHVMLKIHQEFSELFRGWFAVLIEGEMLTARLDDDFSPIIAQDGYETATEHLSGGEKTSCALAYRLALNKVINDMISGIKTKDIIILDEPTDGFSSEQLEKVREVLKQLKMQQIIIVSHEEKVESFVDSRLRVVKTEHVSRVEG